MSINNIVGSIVATDQQLPPIKASGYEFVVAANGLFIRAADQRMEAVVLAAHHMGAFLWRNGLHAVKAFARLKSPRLPREATVFFLDIAKASMPDEVLIQCFWNNPTRQWIGDLPLQTRSPGSIEFSDNGNTIIDLHSHGAVPAFFSQTDNADELGLRFYVVIGRIDTPEPEIACRVGVYGHHMPVPASTLFEDIAPFRDVYAGEDHDDAAV